MIVIQLIPDEIEIPLGRKAKEFEGAVAFMRPFDLEEHAQISDDFAKGGVQTAALATVRKKLIRIDGLSIMDQYGKVTPFDKNNPLHWAQLPFAIIDYIFARAYSYRDDNEVRVVKAPEAPPNA